MPVVVLLIVVAVIVFLLYKSEQDARQQHEQGGARPSEGATAFPALPKTPSPRAKQARPSKRRAKPKVDEEALAAHVVKLRDAISKGLIDIDEAVASVMRQTDGALGHDAARKLLEQEDAA